MNNPIPIGRLLRYSTIAANTALVANVNADIYTGTGDVYSTSESFSFLVTGGDYEFEFDVLAGTATNGDYFNSFASFMGSFDLNVNGVLEEGDAVDSLPWAMDVRLWYFLSQRIFGSTTFGGSFSSTEIIFDTQNLAVNSSGYIGFNQDIGNGQSIYGWVELKRTMDELEVVGWAFDDSGEMIDAGQIPSPGALGLLGLAAGASGIRRKRGK